VTRLVFAAGGSDAIPAGAAESLRAAGLLIYPTDTLYGVGVDPRSPDALARLVRLKGRDEGKPLPLLLAGAGCVDDWATDPPDAASRLMACFWPGALTIVLPAAAGLLPEVTGGGGTVGLRVPAHPVARALASAAGGAITGTSANRSGEAGLWQSAESLLTEFSGEADWILWDGPVASALPSTVVAVSAPGVVTCIREGAIPFHTITEYLHGRR
jgi:L-threonylcarbamoyladenylate synthase